MSRNKDLPELGNSVPEFSKVVGGDFVTIITEEFLEKEGWVLAVKKHEVQIDNLWNDVSVNQDLYYAHIIDDEANEATGIIKHAFFQKKHTKGADIATYHETLSSALREADIYAKSKGFIPVGEFEPDPGSVTIERTATVRFTKELATKDGLSKKRLQVSIYRMESGRYELTVYTYRSGGVIKKEPDWKYKNYQKRISKTNKN